MIQQDNPVTMGATAAWEDWTVADGRTNSSPEYVRLCGEVERIIRDDAHTLMSGGADRTARLIMAQLAHKQHMIPESAHHAAVKAAVMIERETNKRIIQQGAAAYSVDLFGPDKPEAVDAVAATVLRKMLPHIAGWLDVENMREAARRTP